MKKEKIIEAVWFVLILGLFIVSVILIKNGSLQERVASFGIWAPLILLVFKISTLVIAPLGGTPIYLLSGALFGNFNGLMLMLLGDLLGSSICFYLSRIYGLKVLKFFVGGQNVERILKTVSLLDNKKSFIKARFAFISMPELLSYASGLSKINFWTFSVINLLFYIPIDIVLVFFGSQIASLSIKYFFIYPLVLGLFALSGFLALYKDYQKTEGM